MRQENSIWGKNIQLLKLIADAYRRQNLCLFIGAGVSKGCGLPLWDELIRTLFIEANRDAFPANGDYGTIEDPKGWGGLIRARIKVDEEELKRLPAPIQSRYCKRKLGDAFPKKLQEALYSRRFNYSDTIRAVTNLNRLKAICTYNYDDLIEKCGKTAGNFRTICSAPVDIGDGEIPIYHVHGFLPSDQNIDPCGAFVLSEDEYHKMYADPYYWANLTQLTLLTENTCLFIGLSFDDPNLRRLLDIARRIRTNARLINIIRFPVPRPQKEKLYFFDKRIGFYNEAYDELGVANLWIDDYEPDIPIILNALSQQNPAQFYIDQIRKKIISTLSSKKQANICKTDNCDNQAIENSGFCMEHEIRRLEIAGTIPVNDH